MGAYKCLLQMIENLYIFYGQKENSLFTTSPLKIKKKIDVGASQNKMFIQPATA